MIGPSDVRRTMGRALRNARRKPTPSFGSDFVSDISTRLPGLKPRTIFDVGAHIGISALEFSDCFPQAIIYAFEPSSTNLDNMKRNLRGVSNVKFLQCAVGESESMRVLSMDPAHPSTASLVHQSRGGIEEQVKIITIDSFCANRSIQKIDVLKIDTEGYELQVIKGAERMLSEQKIQLVKAELAIDPDLNYHTSLWDFCSVMHDLNYRLFGFYNQAGDQVSAARLRRFDAAFIAGNLCDIGPLRIR